MHYSINDRYACSGRSAAARMFYFLKTHGKVYTRESGPSLQVQNKRFETVNRLVLHNTERYQYIYHAKITEIGNFDKWLTKIDKILALIL